MNFKRQKNLSTVLRAAQAGLVAFGLTLGLCAGAQAQSEQDEMVIEEVIVTAQKREIGMQDVPVSVNVLTGAFLEENNINTMQEAFAYEPSVSFSGSEGTLGTVSMRGIGTNVFGFAEPTVSFVVDGVPLARQGQGLMDLVDIERIEILRGPQSTLFGKNASAGVISIVTRGPGSEFESWVKLTATDDDEYYGVATISGPMSEKTGGLLTAYYKERDGNVFNYYSNSRVNSREDYGVRGRFDWQASDAVSISLIGNYQKNKGVCCAGVLLDPAKISSEKLGLISPVEPRRGNMEINQDIEPGNTSESVSLSAQIDWDIGEYMLTSITAWNDYQSDFVLDMDASPAEEPYFFASDLGLIGIQEGIGDSQTFSQEFRLLSPTVGKFDYMLGFFYFDYDTQGDFDRIWDLCFAPPFIPGTNCGFVFTFPQGNRGENSSKSTSLFAHGTYHFSDAWRLTGGLRIMHEKISYDFTRISPTGLIFGPTAHFEDSHSETNPMGDISLQWDVSDGTMLYGKYTRGYKGQAYGLSSSFNDEQAAEQPVAGEDVDSFEIGSKSMLWGNRLRLNATAFLMKYKNYQAQAAILDPAGQTEFRLINAGEIETSGLEIEFTALLTEGLTFSGAATFLDAKFTDFPNAPCYDGQPVGTGPGYCMDTDGDGQGNVQDLAGFPLPAAPDLKYNLSLRYDFQMESRFVPFLQLSHVYVDDQTFALDQDPVGYEPSYRLWHASAGLMDRTGRWLFTVFGRNLSNDPYYTSHSFGQGLPPRDVIRYWGVTARVNF